MKIFFPVYPKAFSHISPQYHTCYVFGVIGVVCICEHTIVSEALCLCARVFMHSLSVTETAAVPDGVCFEVVPGIRSQGGANPSRSLPW